MVRRDTRRAGAGGPEVAMRVRARDERHDEQRDRQYCAGQAKRRVPHGAQVARGSRQVK
jgi:hypothetical protein